MSQGLSDVIAAFAKLAGAYYGSAVFISIVLEVFAQATGRRARTLRAHLTRLFSAPLANRILENPLIRKVRKEDDGGWFASAWSAAHRTLKGVDVPIAYIDPRDFALALMFEAFHESKVENRARKLTPNPAGRVECDPKHLPAAVHRLLETLLQDTNGNPAHIQERLEAWFRRDQAQLSAQYGTTSRCWGVLLGTSLASFVGLDTLTFMDQILPWASNVDAAWVVHLRFFMPLPILSDS